MRVFNTSIDGVLIVEPIVHEDERGYFFEGYNKNKFTEIIGIDMEFVQDNYSLSSKGVLRGLHYQVNQPQAKLVRVLEGEIFDVAVDIRKTSSSFGKWVGLHLSAENRRQVLIPKGFAHGFMVVSDRAEVMYKVTDYYVQEHERCIRWDDSTLGIYWPDHILPILSLRDREGQGFQLAEMFE